jgi:DNA helicase-2/ATP-dependent DNA helicase PcrA
MSTLNKFQNEAVRHGQGPLLIVAGAGTGKTTVLIERLNYLLTQHLAEPEEILIITFTEKAAGELEDRADKILPYGYTDLWVHTFHGFCKRILDDHALDIGLPGNFKVLTATEQWMFLRKHLDEFALDYYRPLGNPTKFIHELIKHFSKLKDEDISAKEYLDFAERLKLDKDIDLNSKVLNFKSQILNPKKSLKSKEQDVASDDEDADKVGGMEVVRISELANAYHKYNQLLLDNGCLDFGDLITYTIKLLRERPNILEIYRAKFKYIMVDEFQDTNWAQYELIKILAAPQNNLLVVGDDNQSVYKFRGASLSNIMQFKDDYPQAKTVVLTDNYRSGQVILDVAYDFIKYNDPNTLETKLGISKKLTGHKDDRGVTEVLSFATEQEEVRGVVAAIAEIYRASAVKWSDFAILVRANDTAVPYIGELTKLGIPNVFVSLKGLYYKPIIIDVLAYFKLLDNYHESSALFRVLSMDVFKIGYTDIVEINKFAHKKVLSTYEALKHAGAIPGLSPESLPKINQLLLLLEKHAEYARREKASYAMVKIILESGIIGHLDLDRDQEIFDYLNQLYNHIKNYENSEPDFRLKDLLAAIEMEKEAGESGNLKLAYDDEDKLKIMTIHAAKGLEFKYVFVVGMVDKRFPTIAKKDKIPVPLAIVKEKLPAGDTHIEEERRLFYVAMTRAKDRLFLTYAGDYGGAAAKKPSKFLLEAGFEVQATAKADVGVGKSLKYNLWEDMLKQDKLAFKQDSKIYLPAKFSFSQIEAYSKCPLQYKYAFILKIPSLDKPSLNFGRVMHNTLKQFFTPLVNPAIFQQDLFGKQSEVKFPSREDLLDIYESAWNPEGFRSKQEREEYYKKGKAIFRGFYDKLETDGWPNVAFLEKNFTIKMGSYAFKGAIDRVDSLPDGTWEIVDYKTGSPKEKIDFNQKRQLILYKLAVEEIFQKPVSKLTFYYLENNSTVSFSATDKQMEKLREQILEIIDKIKQCRFIPTPGIICSWCDFNGICEFRQK